MIRPILSNTRNPNIAVIYYHKNCPDGIMAAGIAQLYLEKAKKYQAVLAMPTTYGEKLYSPEILTGGEGNDITGRPVKGVVSRFELFFVDFCPSSEVILSLTRRAAIQSITVLDHHQKTLDIASDIKKALQTTTTTTFDLYFSHNESGASLTLEYFRGLYPEIELDPDVGNVARWIRTYDLWEHDGDNNSPAAHAAVGISHIFQERLTAAAEQHGPNWKSALSDPPNRREMMDLAVAHASVIGQVLRTSMGEIMHRGYEENSKVMEEASALIRKNLMVMDTFGIVPGVRGTVVNEVANQVKINHPRVQIVVTYEARMPKPGARFVKVSLRAGRACTTDLNALAKAITDDGGGHRDAAGLSLPIADDLSDALIFNLVYEKVKHARLAENVQPKGE